ncbi:MAG: DUF4396 domain-containing protein [Ignavibacteria bacterium]|nr:DUF4396 domain-containing protein [Ignavibacteria bacterium]
MDHSHQQSGKKVSEFILAVSATFHCLIGCGIGEVVGMIISSILLFDNLTSIAVSVLLGFIAGLALGILPLRRSGFTTKQALNTVIVGEGISIAVMEAFEVLTQVMTPGVMESHLTDSLFWTGMFISLIVGFIAALPINYIMIKRGVRHIH